MKIGDLVKISKWCIGKGRSAIIIGDEYDRFIIKYTDNGEEGKALPDNLIKIN